MTDPEEMDEETKAWLDAGLSDLRAALDEIERDVPPEELEAWLASFRAEEDLEEESE